MDKQELLAQARDLVSEAETAKALELVEDFLKASPPYRTLYRQALTLSAQFNKTRRDEQNNLLSFENAKLNYAQVNDGILTLLDNLEGGSFAPAEFLPPASKVQAFFQNYKWQFWVGVPTLLLSVAVLFLVLRPGKEEDFKPGEEPSIEVTGDECSVNFQLPTFNLLVLPFYLVNSGATSPDPLIVEKLEDFSNRNTLRTDVETCYGFKPKRLLNFDDAGQIGRGNNARIVIWGRAEATPAGSVVKTRFKYLGGDEETFAFKQIRWQGEKQVDTVKTISSITTQGDLTAEVEQVMLLVLGVTANELNQPMAAIAALESFDTKDSAAILMKNMLLADNYLAVNEPKKARDAYDSLLVVHPNYWLARNNRAGLRMESGDYLGAVEDFTAALNKRPTDPDILNARARAYLRSEQLMPAREDLQKLVAANPQRRQEVAKTLESTNALIAQNEQIALRAERKPATRMTKKEVVEAANANRKLGNTEEVKELVEKGLEADPTNPKLITIEIDEFLKNNRRVEARSALEEAVKKGVKRVELARHSPNVKEFIEQLAAEKRQ